MDFKNKIQYLFDTIQAMIENYDGPGTYPLPDYYEEGQQWYVTFFEGMPASEVATLNSRVEDSFVNTFISKLADRGYEVAVVPAKNVDTTQRFYTTLFLWL